ncbi:MAG: CPBP family intramembrane glutamic endopeptidase [Acidimicrobiales bacterium]
MCGRPTSDNASLADESPAPALLAIEPQNPMTAAEPTATATAALHVRRWRFASRAAPPDVTVLPEGHARRMLAWETRLVMFAFLVSGVISAVLVLAAHVTGVADIARFPVIVHSHPVLNMLLGMLAYVPVLSVVPLALFLLARTGQTPSVLGLGVRHVPRDLLPALGIGAAAFGLEVAMLLPFAGLLVHHHGWITSVSVSHEPKYYVIEGVFISAVTAVTEEVLVNGYLVTRLGQLGWTPRSSLLLSLTLRTSYHLYYGLGFLLTIPFGFLVTRSFQKHHRLTRPILAHFLFDAVLITIAILA